MVPMFSNPFFMQKHHRTGWSRMFQERRQAVNGLFFINNLTLTLEAFHPVSFSQSRKHCRRQKTRKTITLNDPRLHGSQ